MWLEAIVTQEDLVSVMGEFLPVRIYLHHEGEHPKTDRWLMLHPAREVTLVPDKGVRVACPAEFSWSLAGLHPKAKLDELRVLFKPQIVEKANGQTLEFSLEIEESDFHSLPDFIDATVAKAINAVLATQSMEWDFSKTLTRQIPLGETLDPIRALGLESSWGKVRIGSEAMTLAVSFKVTFVRPARAAA